MQRAVRKYRDYRYKILDSGQIYYQSNKYNQSVKTVVNTSASTYIFAVIFIDRNILKNIIIDIGNFAIRIWQIEHPQIDQGFARFCRTEQFDEACRRPTNAIFDRWCCCNSLLTLHDLDKWHQTAFNTTIKALKKTRFQMISCFYS